MADTFDIRNRYGRRQANYYANPSFAPIAQCVEEFACKDDGTLTSTESDDFVISVTIDDGANDPVLVTFPAPVAVTDEAGVKAAIVAALQGGIPTAKEIDTWVYYAYDLANTTATFSHIGVLAITALTFTDGAMTIVRTCTTITQTRFSGTVEDGSTPTINGTTVGAGPYVVGTDEEALETAIETRLTADGVDWQDVQVSNDGTDFVVNIWAASDSVITINDVAVTVHESKQVFA